MCPDECWTSRVAQPRRRRAGGRRARVAFADATFDAVTCGLALSHFRPSALDEIRRVLRDGGRLVATAWGPGDATAFFAPMREVLERHGARDTYDLDEDTWSDSAKGADVLRRVGFDPVSVETESFDGLFAGADEVLAWVLAWPLVAARLTQLDEAARVASLREAREAASDADLGWRVTLHFYVAVQPATDASQHEHSV